MEMELEETIFQQDLMTKLQNFCLRKGVDEKDVRDYFIPEISLISESVVESKDIETITKELRLEEQRVKNRKSVLSDCFSQYSPDLFENDELIIKEGVQFSWKPQKIVVSFYTDLLCLVKNPFDILNYLYKALIPLNPKAYQELRNSFVSKNAGNETYGNFFSKFEAKNCNKRNIEFIFHHSNLFKSDNDTNSSLGCIYPDSFTESKFSKKDDENSAAAVASAASIFDAADNDQRYDAVASGTSATKRNSSATTVNNGSSSMWKHHMNLASGIPNSNKRANETLVSSSFNRIYGDENRNNANNDLGEDAYSSPPSSLRDYGINSRGYEDENNSDNDDSDSGDDERNEEEDDRRYYIARNSDWGAFSNYNNNNSDRDMGINYCLAKRGKALQIIPKGSQFCRSAFLINFSNSYCTKFLSGLRINKIKQFVEEIANDLAKKVKFPTSLDGEGAIEQTIASVLNSEEIRDLVDTEQREYLMFEFLYTVFTCRKENNMMHLLNLYIHVFLGKVFSDASRSENQLRRSNEKNVILFSVLPKFELFKNKKMGSLKIRAYCDDSYSERCIRGGHKSHEIRKIAPDTRQPFASRDLFTNIREYRLNSKYDDCFTRTAFHNLFCRRITFSANKESKVSRLQKELIYLVDYDDKKAYKYKLNKYGKKVQRQIMYEDIANGDLFIKKPFDEIVEFIQKCRLTPRDVANIYFRSFENMSNFWNSSEIEREYFKTQILPYAKIFFTNVNGASKVHNIVKKQNSFRVHRILGGISNIESMSGTLGGFYVQANGNEIKIYSSNTVINVMNANMSLPSAESGDSASNSVSNLMPEISLNARLMLAENAESGQQDENDEDYDDEEKEKDEYRNRNRKEQDDKKNIEINGKRKIEVEENNNKRKRLAGEQSENTLTTINNMERSGITTTAKEEEERDIEQEGTKEEEKEEREGEGEGENENLTDVDSLESTLQDFDDTNSVSNENLEMFD